MTGGSGPTDRPSDGAPAPGAGASALITRRSVLAGAAVAAGSAAAGGAVGWWAADKSSSRRSSPYQRRVDVVVVGGGIAGLTAARNLVKAGRSVVVLEALSRVGGRMVRRSVAEGGWVDLGGQWAGPTQHRLLALSDELGLKRFPSYYGGEGIVAFDGIAGRFKGDISTVRGLPGQRSPAPAGAVHDAERGTAALATLARSVSPGQPWTAPRATALDRQTVADWLQRNVRTGFGRFVIANEGVFNSSGGTLDEVSLLHLLFEMRANPHGERPDSDLYFGGAGQIPLILARQLGDRVAVKAAVRAISQDSSGVTVTTAAGRFRAGHVIVAIPPTLAGAISYDPPLPARRLQLGQRMPLGTLAKVHAVYPTAFWRPLGLSGSAVGTLPTVQATADSSPPDGKPGILTGFVAGQGALSWATRPWAQRRQTVLADYRTYFGSRASSPVDYVEAVWPANPFAGGAFNAFMPPGVWTGYGPALRAPIGRIHWVGAETATRWYGYFDGAISSAEREVGAILGKT